MEFTAGQDEDGIRLDVALARLLSIGRSGARKLVLAGQVKVNDNAAKKSLILSLGDMIAISGGLPKSDFSPLPDPAIEIEVLFEDDDLVVLNKPAKLPCHPLRQDELGTMANGLVHRFPEMQSVGYRAREPGILHRLDNDTSGVLLAAKNLGTFSVLRDALRDGNIKKRYLAVCEGLPMAPEIIDLPILALGKTVRVDPHHAKAKPALTELIKTEEKGGLSLVTVSVHSARRHQIRVHLAEIGFPIVGDAQYGSTFEHNRHCLHAHSICFEHPKTGVQVEVAAPLPSDFQELFDR